MNNSRITRLIYSLHNLCDDQQVQRVDNVFVVLSLVMYSLYRAWLSLNQHCSQLPPIPAQPPMNPLAIITDSTAPINNNVPATTNVSPLNLTNHPPTVPIVAPLGAGVSTNVGTNGVAVNQPDVCLQVGTTMTSFSAHRSVLNAHSGYFKAALATHTGPGPIHVPNVNVDEFSALLTFMYTGYLDLNITSIYNILLATHILHMPRALEICRAYLINQQQQQEQQTPLEQQQGSIIRPIASKRSSSSAAGGQQVFAPIYSNLEKSESTPFRVVEKTKMVIAEASTSKVEEKRAIVTTAKPLLKATDSSSNSSKVIVDIACCDGPVRFHRVVNKNYGHSDVMSDVENSPVNKNAALNKVMQENINKHNNLKPTTTTELFTCLYCNHTFKSQYCYQKHARRHLNPVHTTNTAATASSSASLAKVESTRREVRLLDMNVQYYPCKTCGSKFPSYYFVHKHRKMCHADEMADGENKNNEMVVHHPTTTDDCAVEGGEGSCSSGKISVIIDVEETDGNV